MARIWQCKAALPVVMINSPKVLGYGNVTHLLYPFCEPDAADDHILSDPVVYCDDCSNFSSVCKKQNR